MAKRMRKTALAGAVLAAGTVLALPGAAMASTHHSFAHNQAQLEAQLSARVTQLARLGADVSGSTSLTSAHAALLTGRVTADTANINALVAKVPTDTTQAQLNVDRAAMLKDNRVFAVLTPQVFQTIEADAIAAQVTTLQANESSLQSAVNSLVGQHGYQNAFNHYVAFVKLVNRASADASSVAAAVLAQMPQNYPGDTHIFVHANTQLRNADIALANANYDAAVIGLAAGGYTGA